MSPLTSFLRGVRVLDLSRYVPGPLASLLLADMGAEVVKIEPPSGDDLQGLGPRGPDGSRVFYEAINAGKAVLQLDLKKAVDKEVLLELLATADVLIEGFRPGAMKRLGLDYKRLETVNPRLIYCSIRQQLPRPRRRSTSQRHRRSDLFRPPGLRHLRLAVRGDIDPRRAAWAGADREGLRDRPCARRRRDAAAAAPGGGRRGHRSRAGP